MTLRSLALATVVSLAFGASAHAATCGGAPPADAVEFRGPVLEVLDGERLCVALAPDPSTWVPVRLADARINVSTAPAPRGALMAASFGQDVTCRIVGRDEEGVIAECRSDRGSVGRLSQARKMLIAGEAWR
jgi:hypothetical protein